MLPCPDCSPDGNICGFACVAARCIKENNKIHIWEADGTSLNTFEVPDAYFRSNIGIGDIDNDGNLDLLIPIQVSSDLITSKLLVTDIQRNSISPNWPKDVAAAFAGAGITPSMTDINNDGLLEIFVFGNDETGFNLKIHGLNHLADELPGWPFELDIFGFPSSTVSLGDVDNNGEIKAILKNENKYLIIGENGSLEHQWNSFTGLLALGTVINLADLDNDGDQELLTLEPDSSPLADFSVAFHVGGGLADGFPLFFPAIATGSSTLCDLNNDGNAELIITGTDTATETEGAVIHL